MTKKTNTYMDMLSCHSEEQLFAKVRQLTSSLTDREHDILSVILQLHAAVEDELRQVLRDSLHDHLFLSDDDSENSKTETRFIKMVSKLGFINMYRLLKPALKSWPYPELDDLPVINETRNQATHGRDLTQVEYKGRNPFEDADCLAQMFLDVFAIRKVMKKFRDHAVNRQATYLRRYIEKYGPDLCN